jgi:hypothetical protein
MEFNRITQQSGPQTEHKSGSHLKNIFLAQIRKQKFLPNEN